MEEAPPARPLTPRLEGVLAPISEKEPVGMDVTYEDSFQQLKSEINKIGSASGGADFDRIVELAMQILKEQSKDLNAASYLALGLCRVDGWKGIAEGFGAVRHLAETYWEDLYPLKRRMAARRNTMQFVVERLGEWMELNPPGPQDREALLWAVAEVEALQAFAMEEMGDDAPAFSLVLRVMRDNLRRLPDPAEAARKAEEARAAAEAQPASPAGNGAPGAAPVATGGGMAAPEIKTSDDAAIIVNRIAAQLRQQNEYDSLAFRLVRVMRFGILDALPPNENGKTLVEPPEKERRLALIGFLEQGNYPLLVSEAEQALLERGMHFWLDLQRLAASGLAALGFPAKAAHRAVLDETANLVRRVPGLAKLRYSDGTPFADPITMDWLAEIAASGDGEGGGDGQRDEAFEADLEEAKKLAAGGEVAKAVRKLSADGGAPRSAFQRRLAAADLCFKAGRPDVARSILEALDEAIERHRLDEWEPGLAVSALRLLHRCYEASEAKAAAADKPGWRARGDAVFARICRTDPAEAMS